MKGEIYALLAALNWSVALLLFKRSGEDISPMGLNLFKNLIGSVLLLVTLLIAGDVIAPFYLLSWWEGVLFVASGILGIAIADSLLFVSLNMIGVTRFTIVDCTYSPSVIFFSWLTLSETIGISHGIGAALIIAGILTTTYKPASQDASEEEIPRKQLLTGVGIGILAVLAMAYGIVMVKPILEKVPLLWASAGRILVGTIALALWLAVTKRSVLKEAITPHAHWKFSIPGAFLGTYISMIFWLGGFKYAKASTAGLLNQSTLLFALPLSAIFLGERFTARKLAAIALAGGGVVLVTLQPW